MMETMNTPEKRTYSSTTMNTKRYFIYAAALVLMAACQAEKEAYIEETAPQTTEQKVVAPEITAVQESGNDTKSVLDVDGEGVGTIYWTPADEINVFYGTTSTHYVSQNAVNATTAVFTTTDVIGSTESASENIWGLYPYNSSATCTGSAVTTTLPATQYGVPGTFDEDLFITLAHNTTTALKFYNVCGGIKFSLSRSDISSISFRGNNDEDIAGDLSLDFLDGQPNVTITGGSKVITITPKTGSYFSAGEYYYIILCPTTLTNGFTMTFEAASHIGTLSYTSKAVSIKRSVFSKKDCIDDYAEFVINPNRVLYYTSTNEDIVTPYDESAFGAIITSNVYSESNGCILFDADLTEIGDEAFLNCTPLQSVILPDCVTNISGRAFRNCTNLTSINIPEGVISIGNSAFWRCFRLTSITLPDGLLSIGSAAFEYCRFESITIPEGITEIQPLTFAISWLQSISLPDQLTSIGYQSFEYCSYLSSITIPDSVTEIGDDAFKSCTLLTTLSIPSGVVSVGDSAFEGCSGLSSIVFNSVTPPTLGDSYVFKDTNNCPIYVPAGSVDDYKAAENWSTYSDRIFAISE